MMHINKGFMRWMKRISSLHFSLLPSLLNHLFQESTAKENNDQLSNIADHRVISRRGNRRKLGGKNMRI